MFWQPKTGQKIEHDPTIDRLIEIRTVLEKIRPIDYKLRYQIDKLVKTAVTGVTSSSDPINFKVLFFRFLLKITLFNVSLPMTNPFIVRLQPNLSALTTQVRTGDSAESSDSDDDDDEATNKTGKGSKGSKSGGVGVYVPPKLNPVHYDGDDTKAERARKQVERARKRALKWVSPAVNGQMRQVLLRRKSYNSHAYHFSSNIIQDLKEECLDIPTEITEVSRAQQMLTKAQKEKEEYEEAYLTRLPVTKAEKHRQRKLTTLGMLRAPELASMQICLDYYMEN